MSYNSYKTSPSYGSSGYSRGRGGYSTRGSYRGRGGDTSSSWATSGSTSRGRGYSGASRGSFNWQKDYSSDGYNSRNRYTSASTGAERYSSRGRGDDTGYRHYSSRTDTSEYSSPRDHRDPRSPDSTRKRMRTEHGYMQASSTRRSHEGGYGASSDYSRYSYPEEKSSYGEDKSRGYRDDRRSTTTYRSREEYSHRKAEVMDSSMPPPSSLPPRHVSTPRGSYRGRLSTRGMRGTSRMIPNRTSTILTRKRSLADSYLARKRLLAARTQAENLRRMRIIKLRRLREAAAARKEGESKDTEDISDEEDEEKEEEEGELEDGEATEKKASPKKTKAVKKTKDEEPEEGEEVDDEEDNDEEGKKETKANGNVHVTIKQDSDARAVSEDEPVRRTFTGKPFIKLVCPHCLTQAVTFQEYTMHFHTNRHINSMRKQSLKHKQTLADMRMSQRQKQRMIEEKEEARGTLSERTKFCHICKLNYRQLKSKHMASEYHQEMVKFLMPICYVCEIEFKSPMLYENHICSLDHIKRKAAKTDRQKRRAERLKDEDKKDADEEDKDVNLDNFMILDSVGDNDTPEDEDEEEEEEEGEGEEKSGEAKEEKKKKKSTDNLGIEHMKTVEVYYCDLCSQYLPRSINPERALAAHCRTRSHLQRYVRHRDDELLRKEAERIHRKRLAKKGAAKEAGAKKATDEKNAEKMDEDKDESIDKSSTKHSEDSAGESPTKKKEASSEASQGADQSSETVGDSRDDLEQDLESGMDDKLWADVDKDLGELLREVEPGNKSSDEDEDSHAGGRYDRFRYSEKGNANAEGDATKTGDENATEADPEDDKEGKKTSESEGGDVTTKKSSATTPTPVAAVN